MKPLLLLLALAPLALAGCLRNNRMPVDPAADVVATPDGPCKDDESFDNGKCSPRIPGAGLTPR